MSTALLPLTHEDCIALLATRDLGRICVVHDGCPVAFPVNYRLVDDDAGAPAIAIRTRPGNSVDHVGEAVGFEIDGVDPGRDSGWSVVVRGRLEQVEPDTELDSYPMISADRDGWRMIVVSAITGRCVRADPMRWGFNPAAYL